MTATRSVHAAELVSPCTGVCTIAADGYCAGCARTLDEIAAWSTATIAERRAILASLPARRHS